MNPRRIRRRTSIERLTEELRGSMVEALLDAQRERRLYDGNGHSVHLKLAEVATLHALELADQHLTLTGR